MAKVGTYLGDCSISVPNKGAEDQPTQVKIELQYEYAPGIKRKLVAEIDTADFVLLLRGRIVLTNVTENIYQPRIRKPTTSNPGDHTE